MAIAGLGGVGGVHLLTLARLGIGGFHIADLDRFDLPNMNRQVGATMSTLGRPKVEVLAEMVRDINPAVRVSSFPAGVQSGNIGAFLDGVDLFVDGFDFFALGIRQEVFAASYARGIPAVTAAPIGMGAGLLVFRPGGMSFEQYFRLAGHPEPEQYLRFLMGVAPRGLHRRYLVDPSRVDLAGQRGPSTGAACQLCSGMVATEAVKLLLRRGRVRAAPFHQHFDAYRGKLAVSWLPLGADGPLQRLKRSVARKALARFVTAAAIEPRAKPASVVEQILGLARWAPSGDNEQPWRFAIEHGGVVRIALTTTPSNVYEYRDGQPIVLAAGMLLESIRIAASGFGHRMSWRLDLDTAAMAVVVELTPDPGVPLDPLCASLASRSVDRSGYGTRRLTAVEKSALAAALGAELQLAWHEPASQRLRLGRLGATATDIRLRMPETFAVHNAAVDWRPGSSEGGIPASAIGLPRSTRVLMRWASRDWRRMDRLNRLGGTVTAGLQMDLLPALRSGAYFTVGCRSARRLDRRAALEAGMALQRFWLVADRLGLAMQPTLATLIFADYGARDARFTVDPTLQRKAKTLADGFSHALGVDTEDVLFMGRIGERRTRSPARSVRHPLERLIETPANQAAMRSGSVMSAAHSVPPAVI